MISKEPSRKKLASTTRPPLPRRRLARRRSANASTKVAAAPTTRRSAAAPQKYRVGKTRRRLQTSAARRLATRQSRPSCRGSSPTASPPHRRHAKASQRRKVGARGIRCSWLVVEQRCAAARKRAAPRNAGQHASQTAAVVRVIVGGLVVTANAKVNNLRKQKTDQKSSIQSKSHDQQQATSRSR